jgi:hypothetical protein
MTAADICNFIGLVLNLIGAGLLFVFVTPRRAGRAQFARAMLSELKKLVSVKATTLG